MSDTGLIRISPEALEEAANRCVHYGDELDRVINEFRNEINSLEGHWDGRARERFVNQFEELYPAFMQMRNLAPEMGGQLRNTAQIMIEADQQISQQFGAM